MTKAPRTVSVQVGLMQGPQGEVRRAYRATVDLTCARCGGPSPEGSIFARRGAGRGGAPVVLPHCGACLPLRPCPAETTTTKDKTKDKEVPR